MSRLEAAGRHAREQLRRSAATRQSLLDLVGTSCLAELAKLGRVEELDLSGFLTGVVEILVQFLPLSEAVVTVAFEGAEPLAARAGRGGVGAVPADHDLVVQDSVVGSPRLVGRGRPVEPTFVGAVASEVSGRLGAVLDRERVRRRGLGA